MLHLRTSCIGLLLLIPAGLLAQGKPAPRPDSTRRDSAQTVSAVRVQATRGDRRVEDEPLRVEVLGEEEVEEKLLMTPGDISMLLNETTGLRVQTVSPGLGSANIRIQGLRGRYAQVLVDGLPLHGAQTGGLGLLQIPPMDLGSVEIIKGISSALYGGSALGGVVNLVSRRPGDEPIRAFLVNQTTLGGTDGVAFIGDELTERWSYTMLAGTHAQQRVDRDGDGWSDIARYERAVLRPRVFWRSPNGHNAMFTAGFTDERRAGGTAPGDTAPDGLPFRESLATRRADIAGSGRWLVGPTLLSLRGTIAAQRHGHRYGSVDEDDRHRTTFVEASLAGAALGGSWVLGVAFQQERFDAEDVAGFDYDFRAPALFGQHTVERGRLAATASARVDEHSRYGTQFSPRLSVLMRLADSWSLRASAGEGFFAPTPFTEEVDAVGLRALNALPALRAERGRSGSLDLNGTIGEIELLASVFASHITNAVGTRQNTLDPLRLELVQLARPTNTHGVELGLRAHLDDLHVGVGYTWLHAREDDPATGLRRGVPLTPTHSLGGLVAWEIEDKGRIGFEVYRTGVQPLADDPFRTESEAYTHVGILAERHVGAFHVFVNAENLLDYRQTRASPLLRTTRGPGGRWTTDVWGPLDGRVFNVGLRF
jgi:outer membrane receptor for ferrienterochelin and colicins